MEKKFKRTTVTSALPYANGPVHIGHLAGVYVPADIYVRYLRLKKEDVLFIGGSDEHGVPITIRAKKEGVTPQDVVDRYHYLIKKSFEEFGVSFDVYSRTTSKTHHELASDFFKTLYNKGEFIEKTSEQYYDEEAKTFLADRYITGECPHCHSEGAYGDQCEKCGTSLSPTDLINPKSAISGSKPVMNIRAQILWREDELNTGDLLMVAKNNYFWTEKEKEMDFIANGETAVVRRVRRTRELYGFRFADVTLVFPDYNDFELEVNMLLDTLHTDSPALPKAENDRLFYSVLEDYADITVKRERMKKMKADPYYNALQVKYAYAVTCHKAQGGQWRNVFLDQGYMTDEYLTPDYFRWLYTAFTRATGTLYLVNYPKEQIV